MLRIRVALTRFAKRSGAKSGAARYYVLLLYWAKLNSVSIVADVPSNYLSANDDLQLVARPFWLSPESEQAAIVDALGKTEAKVILTLTPAGGVPIGWQQVDRTRLCVKFLGRPARRLGLVGSFPIENMKPPLPASAQAGGGDSF